MARFHKIDKEPSAFSKPHQRHDGELYERPEPNPFSADWNMGYEDGFEGRPQAILDGTKLHQMRYDDGFETGQFERESLDRTGSSNA